MSDSSVELRDRQRHGDWLLPSYEDYSFVNVPGTATGVLDVTVGPALPEEVFAGVDTEVSHVLVVLVGGLGYDRWRRDCTGDALFGTIARRGTTTPLTTTVPSSTATAITSVHTAATPAEHGIFGWDVYLPDHDTVVESFPFTVRVDCSDGDRTPPIEPADLTTANPIYPALSAAGVDARVVQPSKTLGTAYANNVFRGAKQIPYGDVDGAAETVRILLETAPGPTYTYLYLPQIDTVTHKHGGNSRAYHRTLAEVSSALSRQLLDELDSETADDTLVIVTADHDMIDVEPGPTGCIDLSSVDAIGDNLARTAAGDRIPPFGDPRATHLRLETGTTTRVTEALSARGATAFTRREIDELGLFAPPGSAELDDRCGDVVVVHDDKKLVHEGIDGIAPKVGVHGGLTPREMLVPFATARLSMLKRGR